VLDLEEHGTRQTCSSCGLVNEGLEGSKVLKCERCGYNKDWEIILPRATG